MRGPQTCAWQSISGPSPAWFCAVIRAVSACRALACFARSSERLAVEAMGGATEELCTFLRAQLFGRSVQALDLLAIRRGTLADIRSPEQPPGAEAVRQRANEGSPVEMLILQPIEIDVRHLEMHVPEIAELRDALCD